jgi:hypothetical protein
MCFFALQGVVMIKILAGVVLFLCAPLAMAVNWEASITNTNTPVLDSDIQSALGKGISPSFANAFPGRHYGIYVLLDSHLMPQINGDLVYMALGLSRRLQNGAMELPVGRFSDVLILPQGSTPEAQKQAVTEKLTAVAASFSRAMIQNKPAFDQAASSRPQSTGHWSEWPDYQPGSSGAVSGGN